MDSSEREKEMAEMERHAPEACGEFDGGAVSKADAGAEMDDSAKAIKVLRNEIVSLKKEVGHLRSENDRIRNALAGLKLLDQENHDVREATTLLDHRLKRNITSIFTISCKLELHQPSS